MVKMNIIIGSVSFTCMVCWLIVIGHSRWQISIELFRC